MRPSDAKYSPGPWSVSKKSKLTGAVVAEDGEVVCDPTGAGRYEDEAAANANLISAAPEMLECLKDAVAEYGCYGCRVDGKRCLDKETFTCNQEESCPAKRWMVAIRKAEGLK